MWNKLLLESYPSPILPIKPTTEILDSSPKYDPKSVGHVVVATVFLPFLSLNHFGLFSRCNCQQWSSSCPFFLQCLQEGFSSFLTIEFVVFPFHFLLSSFLEDNSPDTPTLVFPASIYVAWTKTSSRLVGPNMNKVFRICVGKAPIYFIRVSWVCKGISNINPFYENHQYILALFVLFLVLKFAIQ